MKNLRLAFAILLVCCVSLGVNAKKGDGGIKAEPSPIFKDVKVLPSTPVKDQARTGTCWSFSGLSFLESEMLRLGKPEVDLSEMFIIWHAYSEKAIKDIRLHGSMSFSGGGAFHDVTNMIREYGIVPDTIYRGLNYGETKHMHGEMDQLLKGQVDAVIENKNQSLSTAWHEAVEGTLDSYLGEIPLRFNYLGKEYTPQSFARDFVGLDMDDYVEISSFTHHPFYTKFILEVPDNWSWDQVYNVPMNEMQDIIDNSLANGYTVAWAADISEKGFSTSKFGVALVTEVGDTVTADLLAKDTALFVKEYAENTVTQEMRQAAFDNYKTTDDHGMHIIGTATDPFGHEFYKVKNSWGKYNKLEGYFYASKPYVNYKSTCIMVNKNVIPRQIRKKLGM
jgi:bleomycin hydrolase